MAGPLMGPEHVSRVRILFKTILKLHRGLPTELKAIGDDYVKSEFKRHVNCEQAFIAPFMTEWAKYALTMAKQLQSRKADNFGKVLSEEELNKYQDHQVGQLYTLFEESNKPRDPENPLGDNPSAKQTS